MIKQYMKYIATEDIALDKELETGAKVVLMVPFLLLDERGGSYTAGYNVLFEKDDSDLQE